MLCKIIYIMNIITRGSQSPVLSLSCILYINAIHKHEENKYLLICILDVKQEITDEQKELFSLIFFIFLKLIMHLQ